MPTDAATSAPRPDADSSVRGGRWAMGAASLALLTFVTHAANFGFTLLGARLLAPGDFATLTAMLGIVLIGMAPGMALQALTATGVLGGPATIEPPIVRRVALLFATLVAAIMIVLGPALGTGNPVSVVAIGAAAGLLPMSAANEGVLQGRGQFALLGVVLSTGALVKLAVGATGMAITSAVWAAACGIATGYGAQLVLSRWMVGQRRPVVAAPGGSPEPTVIGRDADGTGGADSAFGLPRSVVSAVVMMGLLLVVLHVDAVMARLLLGDLAAGLYAVGATAMRIVFWAPQFVVLLLFPVLVTDPRRRVVALAIGGLAAAGALATLVAAALGPALVPFVFGQEYAPIGGDLWRFAWLGTAAVGLQVLCLSDLATGRREALWLLAATITTIVATLVGIEPTEPVTIVTTVATIVTGAVVLGTARRLMHQSPTGRG